MKTVVITGSQGFLMSYVVQELLGQNYNVIGVDNYSKYGKLSRKHDSHPNFRLFEQDIVELGVQGVYEIIRDSDFVIAGAALVGGIRYFNKYAYDLVAVNERIMANTLDACIKAYNENRLKRLIIISSSMVYEGADTEAEKIYNGAILSCCGPDNYQDPDSVWPSQENDALNLLPPPVSSYGFQKLMCEIWAHAAQKQYGLPYTIIRPFNGTNLGEEDRPGDSHVLPDLVYKAIKEPDNYRVLGTGKQRRCFTDARDIARGVRLALESNRAINETFNISHPKETMISELAELVWKEVWGDRPMNLKYEPAWEHDVQRRVPDVTKARRVLGFEATIPLEQTVREVVEALKKKYGHTDVK